MPRNRGRKASVDVARSERNHGKEAQTRSHGKHTGRAPNEAARRPRDLDSGVDDTSASTRLLVASTSGRTSGPERAVEASDRSKSSNSKALQTTKVRTDRPTVESSDSGDDSSDIGTDSNASDSSTYFLGRRPRPYDGKPDQRVFDEWVLNVEAWTSVNELSRKEVMYYFPQFVTGDARECYEIYVLPTLRSRKWKPKHVFKVLQKHCFPDDHKVRLYEQLKSVKQGNRKVTRFAGEITWLAGHLPHVSDKYLALVFYAGLNPPIRALLTYDNIKLGSVDLETLVRHASEREKALTRLRAMGMSPRW